MDATDRKAWERTQRKARLIDIAERVFFKKGFDGTTVPMIADAAGYNKRTIYLYFKDKEELFLAVVLRGLQQLQATLQAAVKQADGKDTGLRAFGTGFFEFALEHPEYLDLMMIYEARNFIYYETATINVGDRYRTACQKVSEDIAGLILDAIARGIEEQRIRTRLTPRLLMLILWGQIFGVMQILRIRADHFEKTFGMSRKKLFEHFVELVEKALTA